MAADEGPSSSKNDANPTQLRFIKWRSFWVKRTFLSDLLIAEYSLRVLVQRETMLNSKIKALQKTALIESDSTRLDAVTKELGEIHREYYRKERCLYRAIDGLPLTEMIDAYHKLRQHDMWFMRQSLIQDCSDQGGCCSRQCGCCARRDVFRSSRSHGRGHCTVECSCCISHRGFEFPDEEKDEIRQDLTRRLENPESTISLSRYTNSFFGPILTTVDISNMKKAVGVQEDPEPEPEPETSSASKSRSWKRRILR